MLVIVIISTAIPCGLEYEDPRKSLLWTLKVEDKKSSDNYNIYTFLFSTRTTIYMFSDFRGSYTLVCWLGVLYPTMFLKWCSLCVQKSVGIQSTDYNKKELSNNFLIEILNHHNQRAWVVFNFSIVY